MTTAAAVNSVLGLAYAKYADVNPQQPGTAPAAATTATPLAADKLAIRPGSASQPGGVQPQPTIGQPGGLQVPPNNNGIYSQAQNFGKQVGDAFHGVAQNWNNMPNAAKWTVGGGLGLGALGLMHGGGLGTGVGALGLGAAGLTGAGMGLFGDDARRMVGQGAMNVAGFFGHEIPTADEVRGALDPNGSGETIKQVQDAMNAKGENGQVGGWAAGQAAIDKHRAGLGQLMGMGRDMGTTALMGLQGESAPRTAEEAGQMYDQLAAKHQEISDPAYLRNQAQQAAIKTLQAKDKENHGVLSDMFKARQQGGTWANKYRESQILATMQKDPALQQYLKKGPNGELMLPGGNSFEDLSANMLHNAYGEYPMQNKTSALAQNLLHKFAMQQLVTKAARCWAGYEPVPGKKPYSNDSCRPAGSGKKKKKEAEKAAKACCGQTTMTETASSRGETKIVDDKQKTTNSPKPEDVGATQTNTNI
jgi:hypothetical protein